MVVRATKVEIFGFPKERRDAWKQLAVDCQRMTNRLWKIWLCHHVAANSAAKLRAHFEAYDSWKKGGGGDKPQWPCAALEEPLTKSPDPRSFYRILSAEFPHVHSRTRGLLTNAWQSLLNKRKSVSGSLPGWVSILFDYESVPSFTRPLPIPFDHQNAKLLRDGNRYVVEFRIERLGDAKGFLVERCELMVNKRKCASVRRIMDRIIDGEYAWKGSNLVYDRGKWFASLCYEMPTRSVVQRDVDKILYVRPGAASPWRVRIGGDSWRFCGNGMHVEHARRAIIRERSSRKEHYRFGGSNQKGHGRRRANAVWTKLSSRWKDFTKRFNHEVSRQVINLAVSRGCGRIVYLQPKDRQRASRFLSTAGNDQRSSMSWDYFQFGTMLASKCEAEGIEYGAKPKKAKASSRRLRGVRESDAANGKGGSQKNAASV